MYKPISDWDFALFSANLHQYLPEISWAYHTTVYEQWKEWHYGDIVRNAILEGDELDQIRKLPPGVFVLFHTGHHMQEPLSLAKAGLLFDIILDRTVYTRSKLVFDRLQQEMNRDGFEYQYLFSEDASLLLRVRNSLRQGRHILVFADGSSGTPIAGKDDRILVPFLDGQLHLKKGIPLMAHIFKVSLYPILSVPTCRGVKIVLQKSIMATKGESRSDFIFRGGRALFSVLEPVLRDAPWQWECWLYLHTNGMLKLIDEDLMEARKRDPMVLLPLGDKYYLFDRRYYNAQRLNFVLKL
ncbi:lysophospholipid acyltransferase family protein [Sphingobacterium lumbrici]|uniref:hypothetical protein n=1 Tax=Sphingobacterium lumbrici TaxID=2559600 RepID=UPI00112681E9|nr:hypothetical protein [Sphingobacterium lumbrici]